MATKTMATRISLLVKSYAEWQAIKDTFVPLKGEMCIVNVPASTGAVVQEPCVLFKIGDGTSKFSALSYSSALAADVYSWAKKENLDWADITDSFKGSLKSYIDSELPDTTYRIVADGSNKWKLQKSSDKGTSWTDATGVIDLSATIASLEASIAKKVDKEVSGTNGKAYIFNESDGGGAHFVHKDGTESFVGVNDGGESGLMAQIYADKKVDGAWVGSRINVYHNGIFYVSKANQIDGYAKNAPDMEIVVKKDIKDISGALHFVGVTTLLAGETYEQAIARLLEEKSHTAKAGDIVIIKDTESSKEFIYDGEKWVELGDEGLYATKAALAAEASARAEADEALQTNIDTLDASLATIAKTGNVNDLVQTSGDYLILDCNL